ncbi:MAG: UvrD-helicase domain-containing protein [Actinomycetota bacterium]
MRPPTPEQERALAAPGRRVAVTAGAGSGKTTLLAEAVFRDVERDGIALHEILVATYNTAAAAHLLARLGERFGDAALGRGPDRASFDPSAAWIGTFHSLCARIAREHPFAAGVDPGFGELAGDQAAALVEAALDEALEACADPGFDDLLACTWSAEPVRTAARAALDRLRAAGWDEPRLTVPAPAPIPAGLREQVRDTAAAVLAHGDARDTHREAAAAAADLADTLELPDAKPRASLTCTAALKPLCTEMNAAVDELYGLAADREAHRQLTGFAAFFDLFARAYARMKRERGALDFEDLQLAARRVLRNGSPYAFRRVYVDEYQDANHLQDEILDLLGAERTVVVGDAAQSIYGFRHADPDRFIARAAESTHAVLADNHRSQPPLLHALNGILMPILDGQSGVTRLAPAASPRPGAPPLADPPVEVHVVASSEGGATRAQEAEVVADVVAGLRDAGYRWRDVAVLFRALTQVDDYRAALEGRGVPVHLVAGRGFFAHDQVADALALLRLVENPRDELALVRVLASPYVAAGDDDLVAVRVAAGDGAPLWPAVRRVAACAPLADAVERLRGRRRELGLAGLVEEAVGTAGYELAGLGMPDGARRFANLRRLVREAASFEAVRGPHLGAFLRAMEERAALDQDPGEAVLVDPDLDAVRLATIHAVKGQEFPCVVLADTSHGPQRHMPLVLAGRDGAAGIALQRHGERDNVEALGYDALKREALAAQEAEERRLLYVAVTRAERHVAVVGRKPGSGTAARFLADVVPWDTPGVVAAGDGEVRVQGHVLPAAPVPDHLPLPPLPVPVSAPDPPPAPAAPSTDRVRGARLSYSDLALHATCPRRYRLQVEMGLPDVAVRAPAAGAAPWSGADVGHLVHRALERHVWGGPPPAGGWAAAMAVEAGLPASPDQAARAERLVAGVVTGPLAGRIAQGRARAELPFATMVDGVLLTGFMDLLVEEGDGALVVDWKTHALEGWDRDALAAGFRLQQAVYGLVALRAGHPRVECRWVLCEAPDEPVTAVFAASDAPALEAEVRAALDRVRAGGDAPAAVTPQPFCGGCPGLRALCPVATAGVGG